MIVEPTKRLGCFHWGVFPSEEDLRGIDSRFLKVVDLPLVPAYQNRWQEVPGHVSRLQKSVVFHVIVLFIQGLSDRTKMIGSFWMLNLRHPIQYFLQLALENPCSAKQTLHEQLSRKGEENAELVRA